MSEAFVVAIKPSARRTNGAVGRLVNREGPRHGFADRAAAESWAADLASRGGELVWIREANPNDPDDVAAYLVGRTRPVGGGRPRSPDAQASIGRDWHRSGDAADDPWPRSRVDDPGDGVDPEGREQASIDRFDDAEP